MSTIPGFVTAQEAADELGVAHSQVCRYCIDKKLPARKVGNQWLIKASDLKKFKRPPVGNPAFQNQK